MRNSNVFTGKIKEEKEIRVLSKKEQKELFEKRENKFFHWVKVILISLFGLYVASASLVLVWHMLLPECLRWLSKEEVASLEKLFVTGIGAGLIGKFGNKLTE